LYGQAPWFSGSASDPMPPRDDPDRRTFNLDMVALGWAATFIIYPSIPRSSDLNLLLQEAEAAWQEQLGAWAQFGPDRCWAMSTGRASSSVPATSTIPPPRSAAPISACASTFAR
jgi:endonuclease YncB( thermonuclease family)